MFVVSLIINILLLGVVLGWTKGENRSSGETIVTALQMAIVGIFPVIGCIAQWYIIKAHHELEWGGAIATWIVLIIPSAIIAIVIVLTFFGSLFVFMPFP